MHALNTFFRLVRFISNSLIGLVVGFGLGYYFAKNGLDLSFLEAFR